MKGKDKVKKAPPKKKKSTYSKKAKSARDALSGAHRKRMMREMGL